VTTKNSHKEFKEFIDDVVENFDDYMSEYARACEELADIIVECLEQGYTNVLIPSRGVLIFL